MLSPEVFTINLGYILNSFPLKIEFFMRVILFFDSAHDFHMKWIVFVPEDL